MPSAAAASAVNRNRREAQARPKKDAAAPAQSHTERLRQIRRDLEEDFPKNTLVELVNLEERKDYNGKKATVIAVEPNDGRVIVMVDMDGKNDTKKMRIHPGNLKRVEMNLEYMGQNNAPPRFNSQSTIQLREKKESCGGFFLWILEKQLQTRMFYEKSVVQIFVTALIIINFVLILVGNLYPLLGQSDLSTTTIRSYQEVQEIVDEVFLWIFTVELLVNMFAHWFLDFFRDGWNVFDFIIITASHALQPLGVDASAIRILRALRVTRLIGKMRSLRIIVNTLMLSLKSVVILFMLLLLLIAIFAIMSITMIGTPMRDALYRPCQSLDLKAEENCSSIQDISPDDLLKCNAQAQYINSQCTSLNDELRACRAVDLANDFKVAWCKKQTDAFTCRKFQGYCRKHKENNAADEVQGDGQSDGKKQQVTYMPAMLEGVATTEADLAAAGPDSRKQIMYQNRRRFVIKTHYDQNDNTQIESVELSPDMTCQGRMWDRIYKYGHAEGEEASMYPNKGICEGTHTYSLYQTDYGCGDSRAAGCGRWDEEGGSMKKGDWVIKDSEPGWNPVEEPADQKCVFEPLCQTWEDYNRMGPDRDAEVFNMDNQSSLKYRCLMMGNDEVDGEQGTRLEPKLKAKCMNMEEEQEITLSDPLTEENCEAAGGVFTQARDINLPESWPYKEEVDFPEPHTKHGYGGMCNWNENSVNAHVIMEDWNGTGRFDNLGEALYSFFTIVTFEAWPDIVAPIHKNPWPMPQPIGTLFFILYILLSAFLLMNMFVTIFLDKMTEAKEYVKEQDEKRTEKIEERHKKLKRHLERITKVREEKSQPRSRLSANLDSAKDLRQKLHQVDADYRDDMKKYTISKMKAKKKEDPDNYNAWLEGVDNKPKLQTVRGPMPKIYSEGGARGFSSAGRDYFDEEQQQVRTFMNDTEDIMKKILGRIQGLEKQST